MRAVTEKEAAGMWWPHVFASQTDPRAGVDGRPIHNCIGHQCMAWRWADAVRRRVRHPGNYREPGSPEPIEHREALGVPATWAWEADVDAQDGCHWLEPETEAAARRTGYCGKAGAP